MEENILKNKTGFNLVRTGLLTKVYCLQKCAKNGFPITPEQFSILNLLIEQGELYQRQISEITYKDRPNVNRLIKILENFEFIKKVPDVNKRKVYKLCVTPKGKKMHDEMLPAIIEARREIIKNIEKKDMEICLQVLEQIQNNLKDKVKLQI